MMDSGSLPSEFLEKDDIEIYVEGDAIEALTEYVLEEFGSDLRTTHDDDGFRILETEATKVLIQFPSGDCTCCWIRGPARWKTSAELARAFGAKRGGKILCDPGLDYPEIHPLSDGFLQIQNGIETIVNLADFDPPPENI
ncbi:MAG: hypothetical protein IPK50_08620 [Fibrobacterota bacterium]|nr:MAG: hypothetical protein IPK50_08620 [Fibrobacterota bacterium]